MSDTVSFHQVCVRMKQYKDELLASCLTFVLSLHHSIVAVDLKAYCPALEVRFISLTYYYIFFLFYFQRISCASFFPV